ncbi:hypothetical protein SGPA1_41012 [Streptomyces misionensis JCM 4497]
MRETLGTEMSMLRGAQAGRSIISPRRDEGVGDPVFELRLLIARQRSDLNRKLTIRSRSLPAASARATPLSDVPAKAPVTPRPPRTIGTGDALRLLPLDAPAPASHD